METCTIQTIGSTRELVSLAQGADAPVVVFDGEDECLVAMRPSVFEHILFDIDRLNLEERKTLRL